MLIKKQSGAWLEVCSNFGDTYKEGLSILLGETNLVGADIVYMSIRGGDSKHFLSLALDIDEVRRVRDELNEALVVFGAKGVITDNEKESNNINVTVNIDSQSITSIEEQVRNIQKQLSNLKTGLTIG